MNALVSNHSGSFALSGLNSRYGGVFFLHQGKMFKAIAGFDLKRGQGPLLNELWRVTMDRDGLLESFWFAPRMPAFFYELSEDADVDVLFDCKLNYDNRIWGRMYKFFIENNALLVHFEKVHDSRESAEFGEYGFWLALYGAKFEPIEKWEEAHYADDEARQSPPFSRWVLRGCRARGSFVVAFGASKHDALNLAIQTWHKRDSLADEAKKFASQLIKDVEISGDLGRAVDAARYSLSCLQENHGLFAGLPWFHQRWARDELVCVKALLFAGQKSLAKVILFSWLDKIMQDGSLPGVLSPKIADGAWLFARFIDYLKFCDLSAQERAFLLAKLEVFLHYVKKGFIVNNARETWMDSIDRPGARIEVQALALAACKLAKLLKKPVEFESDFKECVKQAFLEGGMLKDGANDSTVRPNLFIAAYVYPELLPKREWIKCFDAVLPKLWLDWGGLSTVDVSDSRFCSQHTGEKPKSYHNGDSWFWINNLAAIVLARADKSRYKNYIEHILKASTDEILYNGAIGHHAELSSAKEMKSQGCFAQAWSAAMYIELLDELFGKSLTK